MKNTSRTELACYVTKNPAGTYSLVGRVPAALAYITKDGGAPTEEQLATAAHCGPGFAKLRTRTWPTAEAAIEDARALGFEVRRPKKA